MNKKIGVYICTGCGIEESLEVDKLSKLATTKYKAQVCKTHPFLCSEEGVQCIKDDMENLDSILIAACSPRVNYDAFCFNSSIITERVNLREQVVWCHAPKDEDTQMLAEDNLRMGIVKVQKTELSKPFVENVNKTILVVGGGITGMSSALEAAKAGYPLVLVEREASLGGYMAKLHKQFPKHLPYRNLEETGIETKIKEIQDNPNIKVFTSAEIEKISGAPGMFDVTIKQNGNTCAEHNETHMSQKDTKDDKNPPLPPFRKGGMGGFLEGRIVTEKVGSIVLATGWKPYDATKLDNLGFGKYPNVITNVIMEELASKGKITRPSHGKEVESVAFIQCAGSRDENHLSYCSSVCCMTSLKQAVYVREQNPSANIYIFYKDIRTPGQYENFYRRVQEDEGIFLTKGVVTAVTEDKDGNLVVDVENTLLGEGIRVKADLVVLAIGMIPTTLVESIGLGSEREAEEKPMILHLEYRLGPELPVLKYGFPDSHFICFPYETQRTGIYAAGCVRQPMDITSSLEDATGAALKAIQCIELTARGAAVHPRTGDLSYPELFMHRCTQCKRCTEECPFGMYNEDEKFNPLPNPTRCRRCALCMGSCPERIISFKDYSVDMISSMIKAIEVPGEEEEKLRILVLVCENDAYPALDMAGINRFIYSPYVRIIPLRCLGSTNLVWIADALAKGIDGILLLGCKHGEDYQCHFIKGSELANYRLGKIQETLDRLVLESDRVRLVQLAISEYNKIPVVINDFAEKIEAIGPNPYKQ